MINISVSTDITRLRAKMAEAREVVIKKAIPSSLNKTAVSARSAAVREIRKKLKRMKAARIRRRISIVRATRNIHVAVLLGRRVKIPPGAFHLPGHGKTWYVRVGKRHRMIVSKSGKSAGRRISSGYQIAPVQSAQVIEEFGKDYIAETLKRVVAERFPVVFERDLRYYGGRLK